MSYDLILKNFIETKPFLKREEIRTFNFKVKQSGEQIGIVSTVYGETFIKRITPDGLDTTSIVKIPFFETIEQRNKFIMKYFYKKYTQADIAIFFNISQPQVHNIINDNISTK